MKSITLLFAIFLLLGCMSSFSEAQLEFKRSTVSGSSYGTLYVKTSSTGDWNYVCANSFSGIQALCQQMYGANRYYGNSFTSTGSMTSSTSSSIVLGVTCSTPSTSNNNTNLNLCTYNSVAAGNTLCSSYVTMGCGSSIPDKGSAPNGVYIGGSPERYIRNLYNGQLQVRTLFSTTWNNIAISDSTTIQMYTANSLCYWLTGTSSTSYWRPIYYVSNSVYAPFAMTSLSCTSSSASALSSCSYSTSYLSSTSTSYTIGIDCDEGPANGITIGNGYSIRLTGSSSYKPVLIYQTSSLYLGGRAICYESSMTTSTVNALCRFAGYGSQAYGYKSYSYSSSTDPIWDYVNCPSYASDITSCSYSSASYCTNQLTINCYSSTSGSSSGNNNYSPSTGSFPVPAVVVPIVWFVIFVGIVIALRARQKARLNGGTVTANSNTSATNYNNFNDTSNTGSNNNVHFNMTPIVAGGMGNNTANAYPGTYASPHQPSPYGQPQPGFQQQQPAGYVPQGGYMQQPGAYTPLSSNGGYGAPPPPPPNFAATTYPPPPPQMTTFDNVHHTAGNDNIPPPPGGYGFMPGFGSPYGQPVAYQQPGVPPS
jgi:hypothetical protein